VIRSYNELRGRRLDRIAALSDGVFAIAMTLIVLEIRVPALSPGAGDGDLGQASSRLLRGS
jgi:TMEM175 potassium channel family protein